jgi:hypothetical protein
VTRLAKILHLDDGEFPALRAQIEAKPIRVGIHEPLPPLPLGAPARAVAGLAELRADRALGMRRPTVPSTPRPIVLTDWSARLADDWTHIADRFDNATDALAREFGHVIDSYAYGVNALTTPILSELTELKAVTIVNWRQALRVHAEDELALYDTPEAGR